MASIEKRLRNGKTTYRVRYRDPPANQRSKVFDGKADAERWLIETDSRGTHTWWALSAVVVATCMLLPDSTVLNVALAPSRLPRSGTMSLRCNRGRYR
jgi:hypothetical protein